MQDQVPSTAEADYMLAEQSGWPDMPAGMVTSAGFDLGDSSDGGGFSEVQLNSMVNGEYDSAGMCPSTSSHPGNFSCSSFADYTQESLARSADGGSCGLGSVGSDQLATMFCLDQQQQQLRHQQQPQAAGFGSSGDLQHGAMLLRMQHPMHLMAPHGYGVPMPFNPALASAFSGQSETTALSNMPSSGSEEAGPEPAGAGNSLPWLANSWMTSYYSGMLQSSEPAPAADFTQSGQHAIQMPSQKELQGSMISGPEGAMGLQGWQYGGLPTMAALASSRGSSMELLRVPDVSGSPAGMSEGQVPGQVPYSQAQGQYRPAMPPNMGITAALLSGVPTHMLHPQLRAPACSQAQQVKAERPPLGQTGPASPNPPAHSKPQPSASHTTGDVEQLSRQELLERYREKKRKRLFTKTIRYHKRKVNADRRPRVKGRFVKLGDPNHPAAAPELQEAAKAEGSAPHAAPAEEAEGDALSEDSSLNTEHNVFADGPISQLAVQVGASA
ncbi:hypothetical protein WJX72_007020 [[Myrmecia] bisecta]|uniref:CCT domain-containing protein n=1 Tax=[Myrmecia] bisecta TaxID=41462 RepID=A0AAW1PP63_9CHLO